MEEEYKNTENIPCYIKKGSATWEIWYQEREANKYGGTIPADIANRISNTSLFYVCDPIPITNINCEYLVEVMKVLHSWNG